MMEVNKHILHIEDDPDLQRYVAAVLSHMCKVTPAGSLKAGRAEVAKGGYDLAIVDFTLPDGSGSELVTEIAEQHPEVPIVVVSAHEITDTMKNVRRVFLKGRFAGQELADTVRMLCA